MNPPVSPVSPAENGVASPLSPQNDGEGGTIGGMNAKDGYVPQHRRPNGSAITALAIAGVAAAILMVYSAAASYKSLSHLAAAHGVPLPEFFPLSADGGLIGLLAVDIGLTVWGSPVGWLRQAARLFALATVGLNAWAGWPDPAAVAMRVLAPVLIVVISEGTRTVLLRRQRESERIPASRWLLAFKDTFRLWRRMKLWRITDYSRALEMEKSRLRAIEALRVKYRTRDWQKHVPGDLAWMLTEGIHMDEALDLVGKITAPVPDSRPALVPAKTGMGGAGKRPAGVTGKTTVRRRGGDVSVQAEALSILASEPDIQGAELARRLDVDSSYGRLLKRKLSRAAPDTGEMPAITEKATKS